MKYFIIILCCIVSGLIYTDSSTINREKLQKESIDFMKGYLERAFIPKIRDYSKDFISPKIKEINSQNNDPGVINWNYLNISMICMQSLYILLEQEYSEIDLTEEGMFKDPQNKRRRNAVRIQQMAKMMGSSNVSQIITKFPQEVIKNEIIPMIEKEYIGKNKLPKGGVDYFSKMVADLQKHLKDAEKRSITVYE